MASNGTTKEILRSHKALFDLMDEFNRVPSRYLHDSWANSWIPSTVYERLKASKRAEKRLSEQILAYFDLNSDFIYDFEDPLRRLALLPPALLDRLVFFCGIAVNAPQIAKVVARDTLKSLKSNIGADAYRFALRKAAFLVGPKAFSSPSSACFEDFNAHARLCGLKCLEASFHNQPHALTARVALKFPRWQSPEFNNRVSPDDQKRSWLLLKKVLVYEVEPTWKAFIL